MSRLNRATSLLKSSLPGRAAAGSGEKKPPGRLKRMLLWLYNPTVQVGKDYRDVVIETGKKMVKKPVKSTIILSFLGTCTYLRYLNPTLENYRDTSLYNHHKLLMLSWRVRNKTSDEFVDTIRKLDREGRLGHQSFFLFSVVYSAHVNSDLCEFSKTYLSPRWSEYLDRIVDVGCLGKWYYMDNAMLDYDINEDEWK